MVTPVMLIEEDPMRQPGSGPFEHYKPYEPLYLPLLGLAGDAKNPINETLKISAGVAEVVFRSPVRKISRRRRL